MPGTLGLLYDSCLYSLQWVYHSRHIPSTMLLPHENIPVSAQSLCPLVNLYSLNQI